MKTLQAEPIRSLKDIERIREILHDSSRDLLLFDLTTQSGASPSYLLRLKVKDMRGLAVGDGFPGSSDGEHSVLNERIKRTFDRYLEKTGASDKDYLFKSRKGSEPLQISSASHLVNRWFKAANLTGLTAFKSLRETWRLHYRCRSRPGMKKGLLEGTYGIHVLSPVDKVSLQETVYLQLLEVIASGRLAPGEILAIEALSEQLRVSHMPVREALSRLEAGGFIAKQRRRGYIVNQLSEDDLKEITTIRLLLECLAAERASLRRTAEILHPLRAAGRDYRDALNRNDVEAALRVNKQFHFTVYRAANMPILLDIIEKLWNRVSPYLHIYLRISDQPGGNPEVRGTLVNHERILRGMMLQDPNEAAEGVRNDISTSSQVVLRLLRRRG